MRRRMSKLNKRGRQIQILCKKMHRQRELRLLRGIDKAVNETADCHGVGHADLQGVGAGEEIQEHGGGELRGRFDGVRDARAGLPCYHLRRLNFVSGGGYWGSTLRTAAAQDSGVES